MSSGAECHIVQVKPAEWFYLLEDGSAPRDAYDWRDYCTTFGPFGTLQLADQHLRRCHRNPGGHCEIPLREGVTELDLSDDKTLARCIREAVSPTDRRYLPAW